MAEYVWGVRMEDDISATANASAKSLEDLSDDVQSLAQTFRVSQAATRALSVNLDQARGLFKTTGGNVSLFKAALKDAGVSALDSSILVGKMTRELQAERRTLLGVTAEEDAHTKAMREAAEERKRTIALIKQQAKEEKARAKAEEKAKKDAERRDKTRANHSATHILHEALRRVLGPHVTQKGSLVAPDRLRFDFSHPKAVTRDELAAIERQVNEVIARNTPVECKVMAPDEAIKAGAMALFGEKYGDRVRVLSMGEDSGFRIQDSGKKP